MARNKKLKEVSKDTQFTSKNQPSDEAKSNGQIKRSADINIRKCLETKLFEEKAVDLVVADALKHIKEGNGTPLRELIKIAKGNETQDINLNGGIEVQKVFIDEKTKKATDKHIDDFINGK